MTSQRPTKTQKPEGRGSPASKSTSPQIVAVGVSQNQGSEPPQNRSSSFQNIQKINNRLRTNRNPAVMMSMQNSTNRDTGVQPSVLMPLTNRSLSPAQYQQLQQSQQQAS